MVDKLSISLSEKEAWIHAHEDDIDTVYRLVCESPTKAVIIAGDARTGKTTLARYAAILAEENIDADVFFTTPQVQNTFGAKPSFDRSGLEFRKLPSPKDLEKRDNLQLIIVDEIAQRTPDSTGGWNQYNQLSNVKFILITHPQNPTLKNWSDLFQNSVKTINL